MGDNFTSASKKLKLKWLYVRERCPHTCKVVNQIFIESTSMMSSAMPLSLASLQPGCPEVGKTFILETVTTLLMLVVRQVKAFLWWSIHLAPWQRASLMTCSLKMTATCFSSFHEMQQRFIIFWRKNFLEWTFSAEANGQHNILLKLTGAPSAPKGKLMFLTFFFNSAAVLSSIFFDVPFSIIFTLITSFSITATTVPEPLKRSQMSSFMLLTISP